MKKEKTKDIYEKYKHIDNQYIYDHAIKIYKLYKPFITKCTKSEKEVLEEYKYLGYRDINYVLREYQLPSVLIQDLVDAIASQIEKLYAHKNNTDSIKTYDIKEKIEEAYLSVYNKPIDQINTLDKIFMRVKKRTLSFPLFRGITSKNILKNVDIGSNITFTEFLSTSFSPSTAWYFQKCGTSPCCIFVFHVNKEMPYIPLYDYEKYKQSSYIDEHEILFARNTTWKVVEIYKTNIHINQTIKCTYEMYEKNKNKMITVYELEAASYEPTPEVNKLERLTDELKMY